MRIAHVTDFYLPRLGGIEMHVQDLACRQLEAGHEVDVITSSPRDKPERERPPSDGGGVVEEPGGPRVHRLTEDVTFPAALHPAGFGPGRALMREGRYDVVHLHAGVFSPLVFRVAGAAAGAEVPAVVTWHSLLGRFSPFFRAFDAGGHWTAWPLLWTAVSDVAAEPVRRLVGPDREVRVLPNGVDPSAWHVDVLPRESDDVLIVAVMRLTARKRPMPLLHMLDELRASVPPSVRLRAVIIGEGPERRPMERYLRRRGHADWVSLPGRWSREQIRTIFRRADIFVAPATLESFGIAALEARCAGLPVVARVQGGIGEFIRDGVDGLLASDDAAMVRALERLALDPGLRAGIARHNRAEPPPVTWADVLRSTEEVYAAAADLVRGGVGATAGLSA